MKCLLRKQQAFCLFWRGDPPAIYRSRAERRRKKGLSADLLHQLRRTLGLELIGIGVQALQRVYGPAAGAELVLHIGGELIEIFLRAGIAAEERVEIRIFLFWWTIRYAVSETEEQRKAELDTLVTMIPNPFVPQYPKMIEKFFIPYPQDLLEIIREYIGRIISSEPQ